MFDKKLWISWTLMAFAIGLILFAIAELAVSAHSEPPAQCITVKDRDHVRELTLSALDQAFQVHVAHLFEVWLKDFDLGSKRARNGVVNGVRAWQQIRSNTLEWDPTICVQDR